MDLMRKVYLTQQEMLKLMKEKRLDSLLPNLRGYYETTSIKHEFIIRRKALVKLYAWDFLSQRTKQVCFMSSIKPNNSL